MKCDAGDAPVVKNLFAERYAVAVIGQYVYSPSFRIGDDQIGESVTT